MIKLKRKKSNDNSILPPNSQIWQEQDVDDGDAVYKDLEVREYVNSRLMPNIPSDIRSNEYVDDYAATGVIYASNVVEYPQADSVVPQADNVNPWLNNIPVHTIYDDATSNSATYDGEGRYDDYNPHNSVGYQLDNDATLEDNIVYTGQSSDIGYLQDQLQSQQGYVDSFNTDIYVDNSTTIDSKEYVDRIEDKLESKSRVDINQQAQSVQDISKIIDQNIAKELTVHKPLNIRAEVVRRKSLLKLIAFVLAIAIVTTVAIVGGFLVVQSDSFGNIGQINIMYQVVNYQYATLT